MNLLIIKWENKDVIYYVLVKGSVRALGSVKKIENSNHAKKSLLGNISLDMIKIKFLEEKNYADISLKIRRIERCKNKTD